MNLLKSLAAVSSMTMFSRVLGFARDAIVARIFGAGMATDAFFVAFKLPNLLRRIFAEGATPDDNGLVIIPGSRGDYSWLVKPVANEKTLHSLAHGAGRKWGRTECKGRLAAKYTATQLSRTELGSRVICRDKQLIFEEAPQAYKSAESVVQCLVLAGLIIPVARLRPVLTLKNSGGKKG